MKSAAAAAASTPVHIIEEDEVASTRAAPSGCPIEVVSVVSAPQHSVNCSSTATSMEDAVIALEQVMETTAQQARQAITCEARRVSKRIQDFKESTSRSSKRQRCAHQEEQAIFSQAVRSNRMIQLLQQMEQIQAQLMDEMNACADDEELREGDEELHTLDS